MRHVRVYRLGPEIAIVGEKSSR